MVKKAKKKPASMTADYEAALTKADAQMYVLRLCVSGMTPRSREALVNLKQICEEYLEGQYQLEVIDLYQQPALAAAHQIIATSDLAERISSTAPPADRRSLRHECDVATARYCNPQGR